MRERVCNINFRQFSGKCGSMLRNVNSNCVIIEICFEFVYIHYMHRTSLNIIPIVSMSQAIFNELDI